MQAMLFKTEQALDPFEAELKRQVEEHKYYINRYFPYELTLEEAFESWCRVVYGPVASAIDEEALSLEFPDISEDELFFRVSKHWHAMKKGGTVSLTAKEAVLDYGSLYADTQSGRSRFQLAKGFR